MTIMAVLTLGSKNANYSKSTICLSLNFCQFMSLTDCRTPEDPSYLGVFYTNDMNYEEMTCRLADAQFFSLLS
jgi:hypothetical protein